jgi:CheY-like chemotaxis protein
LVEVSIGDFDDIRIFRVEIERGLILTTSRLMLTLILQNLIGNAYKYHLQTDTILIKAFAQKEAVLVEVSNTIDLENSPDPAKLFQAYYRHNNVQEQPGMGLGLSLSKSAAEKINGSIEFSQERNLIVFSLQGATMKTQLMTPIVAQRQPLRVAIVEDDRLLRQEIELHLTANDFSVMGVSSAAALDDLTQSEPIDLFIIDLNLPGEGGLSLCKRLRESLPNAGIVIMTARVALHDRLAGYSHGGADFYLTKPISPDELVLVLQNLGKRVKKQVPDKQLDFEPSRPLVDRSPTGPEAQINQPRKSFAGVLESRQGTYFRVRRFVRFIFSRRR